MSEGVPPPPPPPPVLSESGPPLAPEGGPPPPPPPLGSLPPVPEGRVLRQTPERIRRAAAAPQGGSIEEAVLRRGQRAAIVKCPELPGDAEKANQFRKFVLDRDANAGLLIGKGWNPVDVAMMTVEQRKDFVNQINAGTLTKPICSETLVERGNRYPKQFSYELADDCYPAEPGVGKFESLKGCRDEQLIDQSYGSLNKFIDLAYGAGLTGDKIEVLKWLQGLPRDQVPAVWKELRGTGILELNVAKRIYTQSLSPEAAAKIKQLEDKIKANPAMSKSERANYNNQISTEREKGLVMKESYIPYPDDAGRKKLALEFFQSKIGAPVEGSGDDVSASLLREIAKLRAENDSLRAALLSKEGAKIPIQQVEKEMESALQNYISENKYGEAMKGINARLDSLEAIKESGGALNPDQLALIKQDIALLKEARDSDLAKLSKLIEEKGSASKVFLETALGGPRIVEGNVKSDQQKDQIESEAAAIGYRMASEMKGRSKTGPKS